MIILEMQRGDRCIFFFLDDAFYRIIKFSLNLKPQAI